MQWDNDRIELDVCAFMVALVKTGYFKKNIMFLHLLIVVKFFFDRMAGNKPSRRYALAKPFNNPSNSLNKNYPVKIFADLMFCFYFEAGCSKKNSKLI